MAETKAVLPYDSLIAELAGLVAIGATGTLYVTSTENRSIRIQLQDGEIVTCFFGPRQGYKALEMIQSIEGGSFRFDPNAPPITADSSLPTTDQILAELGYAPSRLALAPSSWGAIAESGAVSTPMSDEEMEALYLESTGLHDTPAPTEFDRSLDEASVETSGLFDVSAATAQVEVPQGEFALATELVTLEFACFVGQVASIWATTYTLQNGAPRSGAELRQMIETMAKEIQVHDRHKVRSFIQRVKQRLEPIL